MSRRLILLCGAFLFFHGTGIAQHEAANPANEATQDNSASQVFEIGGDVIPPKLIFAPDPEYPQALRKGKHAVQGTCILAFVVDKDGRPRDVRVIRSLDKRLDQNAVNGVKQWKFKPAEKDGRPVAVRTSAEVSFELGPFISRR